PPPPLPAWFGSPTSFVAKLGSPAPTPPLEATVNPDKNASFDGAAAVATDPTKPTSTATQTTSAPPKTRTERSSGRGFTRRLSLGAGNDHTHTHSAIHHTKARPRPPTHHLTTQT